MKNNIGLKMPVFLKLDEKTQQKLIDDVSNSEMVDHEKRATIESMIFLKEFRKKLTTNPHITMKQVKQLFEAHAEQIKKILLAQ